MLQPTGERDFEPHATHLFDHLHNPEALRSNPLVSDVFDYRANSSCSQHDAALTEIRRRVASAAEILRNHGTGTHQRQIRERQYRIVVRCDLNHETRKVVAHDLGISTRQFSRDRQRARLRIGATLAKQKQHVSGVVDVGCAALAHASVLYELGQSAAAARQFRELGSGASSPLDAVLAFTALADISMDFDRFEQAKQVLNAAALRLSGNQAGPTSAAHAVIALGEARLSSELGSSFGGDDPFHRLESCLYRRPGTRAESEIIATIRCALAWHHSEIGNLLTAMQHVTCGLALLNSEVMPPLVLRERLRHLRVILAYDAGAIEAAAAREELLQLLEFSQASGWLKQSALLFSALATDVTDTSRTPTYCDEAKRLSRTHGALQLRRISYLAAAVSALLRGSRRQARQDLHTWQVSGVSDLFQRMIADDIEAQLAIGLRAYEPALMHARNAVAAARQLRSARALGSALRTMAAVEYKLGQVADARRSIDAAIPLIDGHGSPSSLERALLLRREITR